MEVCIPDETEIGGLPFVLTVVTTVKILLILFDVDEPVKFTFIGFFFLSLGQLFSECTCILLGSLSNRAVGLLLGNCRG